jgi:hypothetical protein
MSTHGFWHELVPALLCLLLVALCYWHVASARTRP